MTIVAIPLLVFQIGLQSAMRLGEQSVKAENALHSVGVKYKDIQHIMDGFAVEFDLCEAYRAQHIFFVFLCRGKKKRKKKLI